MSKVHKKIAKSLKYLFVFLGIFVFIFCCFLSYLVLTNSGRSLTGSIVSRFISSKIASEVFIGSIKISTKKLTLNHIIIYDFKNKPVLTVNKVELFYNNLSKIKHLDFSRLVVTDAVLNGRAYQPNDDFNFVYIVQKLQPKGKRNPKKESKVIIREVWLFNGKLTLIRPLTNKFNGKIDFNDLEITNINLEAKNFIIHNSRLTASVKSMMAKEKSNFTIYYFKTDFTLDTNLLAFDNFILHCNESKLKGSYRMNFDSFKVFPDYINKVNMEGTLDHSIISVNDLSYVTSRIITNEKYFKINGSASGTVSNLKSKNIQVYFGNQSYYNGSFNITGLPDISETFFNFNLKNSNISFADIETLLPNIKFPDYFNNLGLFKFDGSYTGFINDFVAFGNLNTPLGGVITDINFKLHPETKIPTYSGNLSLNMFNLGKFVNRENLLGKVTLTSSLNNAKGINLDDFEANVEANSSLLEFNSYPYRNLAFQGYFGKKIFNGELTINDSNLDLSFKGKIDLTAPKPIFMYTADIKNADLFKLHIVKDTLQIKCIMDIDVMATNIDDLEGKIIIKNPWVKTSNYIYKSNLLTITATTLAGLKKITIESDLANVNIAGNYTLTTLPGFIKSALLNYFDTSLYKSDKVNYKDYFIDFTVDLYSTSFLNKLIKSNMVFNNNTYLKGTINNKRKIIKIKANIPGMKYNDFSLQNINLTMNTDKSNVLEVNGLLEKISKKDSVIAENVDISAITNRNQIDYKLKLYNPLYDTKFDLSGILKLKKDSTELSINNSLITSGKDLWGVNSDHIKIYYKPEIQIPLIQFKHNDQYFKAEGVISKTNPKPLRILFDNMDFNKISPYLKDLNLNFSGIINGQIALYNLLSKPYFDAGIVVNPLIYNQTDTFGILSATADYDVNTGNTNLEASLQNSNLQDILKLEGYIDFVKKKTLDITVKLPKINFSTFEPFVNGIFSNFKGEVSGDLNFSGPINKPIIQGSAKFMDAYFTVNYLKTVYHFNHQVSLDNNSIKIINVKILDDQNNEATVDGVISYKNFSDLKLNLNILTNKIMALNTVEKDNSFYFGQAYASGKAHIFGPVKGLTMDIQVRSEKNTSITMTTYNNTQSGQYSFVRFIDKSNKQGIKSNANSNGLILNLDMDITPDANLELIFESNKADVIKGNGKGNLKLELDNIGNLNMYGSYFIEKGDYYFSALNVIKRKFIVNPGSSIIWKGDPMMAEVNIEADYNLVASIYDLVSGDLTPDEDKSSYRQTFPVTIKIILTESLFSPKVKLDFDILNTKTISGGSVSILEKEISYIKSDEQELNKQVISLLVMHQFLPVNTGIQAQSTLYSGMSSNVSSLISSQISQWTSQFAKNLGSKYIQDIQLGVNYNIDNSINKQQYQQQLAVALSTSLFNDRVTLNGSYDVQNIMGNFEANYQVKKGSNKLKLKVFSRSDKNPIYDQSINRQGIGITFRKDFNNLMDLLFPKNLK